MMGNDNTFFYWRILISKNGSCNGFVSWVECIWSSSDSLFVEQRFQKICGNDMCDLFDANPTVGFVSWFVVRCLLVFGFCIFELWPTVWADWFRASDVYYTETIRQSACKMQWNIILFMLHACENRGVIDSSKNSLAFGHLLVFGSWCLFILCRILFKDQTYIW